jgi:hypothetical protein
MPHADTEETGQRVLVVILLAIFGGTTVLIVLGILLSVQGCGGEGGNVGGGDSATTLATAPPGTSVFCNFGDGNTFSFVLGDNASLDFCTEGGGTVSPDNSVISQPTDSNNRNTTVVNPTPLPTPTPEAP